jgi:hypothetical protein
MILKIFLGMMGNPKQSVRDMLTAKSKIVKRL